MKNKLDCELTYKERLIEAWRDGMLYRFYLWIKKPRQIALNRKFAIENKQGCDKNEM